MKKYYSCYNNGVMAIVSEETYNDIQKYWEIVQRLACRNLAETASPALKHLCVPIFTFAHIERVKESPWFTGECDNFLFKLLKHIRDNGGKLIEGESFYVPFSNGCEVGLHGEAVMRNELAYVTTEQQFLETFGVSISEIDQQTIKR